MFWQRRAAGTSLTELLPLRVFAFVIEIAYRNKRSEITLRTPVALGILENGNYFFPTELVTYKYWSTQEKICNMQSLDYYPD
jgi:hypothetical protein